MLNAMILAVSLQPFVGLGNGELDWNIAGGFAPGSSPNVLSELEFKDIRSYNAGLRSRLSGDFSGSRWSWLAEGEITFAKVDRGHVDDTDYFDDNRTNPYSLSVSNIEGDDILDYWLGAGVSYAVIPGRFTVSATAGGFHKEQNLNFQNGRQVIAEQSFFFPTTIEDLNVSLANDLDSDYTTEWRGYWGAIEAVYSLHTVGVYGRLRLDDGTYYGEGRWNLRRNLQQPKSFSHHADASGRQWEVGVNIDVNDSLRVNVAWLQGRWETDAGVDNTFFTEEAVQLSGGSAIQSTRLNSSNWESEQLRLGLRFRF